MRVFLTMLYLLTIPCHAQDKDRLLVAAASSLQGALEELQEIAPRALGSHQVQYHFASSGALKTQILQGAPIDVFMAAADDEMNELEQRQQLVTASRVNWLSNRLLVIAPKTSGSFQNLEDLQKPAFRRIALGNPQTAPVGRYAWQALEARRLTGALQPRLVYAANARQVVSYVDQGVVQAGIVYASDVHQVSPGVHAVWSIPSEWHKPIRYPAAILRRSKQAEAARRLLAYWQSAEALKVFERHGFVLARKAS